MLKKKKTKLNIGAYITCEAKEKKKNTYVLRHQ